MVGSSSPGLTLPGLNRPDEDCPCRSGAPLDACCGPVHRDLAVAVRAEQLMRARYTAFALARLDVLRRSWHPDTRPHDLALDPGMTWTGLEIVDTAAGGPEDDTGVVQFRAGYRAAGSPGVLQERSRFRRVDGTWRYLDGVPR